MTKVDRGAGTTLQLRRSFAARCEDLFRAWTDPEQVKQWIGPPGGSAPEAEIDLRVGGHCRITMKPPAAPPAGMALPAGIGPPAGEVFYLVGTYHEIEFPKRLVFSFAWEGLVISDAGETLVTVEFHDRGGSTEVVLTHERFPTAEMRAFHEWGWSNALDRLAQLV